MTKQLRIDEFTQACQELNSDMQFKYNDVAPNIVFSNTGRRGEPKFFSISLIELSNTLRDISAHIDEYMAATTYDETTMRDLFSRTVSTSTINALSTVQTLPLFALINKVIYVSNNLDTEFNDKKMYLNADLIDSAIQYLDSQIPDNAEYLDSLTRSSTVELTLKGENVIFYGAPGVGKSHKIEEKLGSQDIIRTVFHPDSQYSDLVGCLKPKMSDEGNIIYEFRPGPFTLALVMASQTTEHVFLVIEEINRASAAAVFGELFQLLDRDDSGTSRYAITLSDPDMIEYLNTNATGILNGNELKIPGNLSLYATMNSSDQAVMPMDTAFKRRWKFEYVAVDFSSCPEGLIPIPTENQGVIKVEWSNFASIINAALEAESIPEDRLLGPWFLSPAELFDEHASYSSLKGKLLLYLWDDVLRHGEKSTIFSDSIQTFGRLITNLIEDKSIFNDVIEQSLSEKQVIVTKAVEPEIPDEVPSIENPTE
jgi:hypothetical protein